MKKKEEQTKFAFDCPYSVGEFYDKLLLRKTVYEQKNGSGLLLERTQEGFSLGLERAGHSGGYWYVANVQEKEGGCSIDGEICYAGNTREKMKWWQTAISCIVIFPLLVFFMIIWFLRLGVNFVIDLFTKKRNNKVRYQIYSMFPPAREKTLREVMAEIGCTERISASSSEE